MVQLSRGDINKDSPERNSVAKNSHTGTISGYSKGNKAPETTNVKTDFSLENLDLSELRGKATYEQIKDYVRKQTGFRVFLHFYFTINMQALGVRIIEPPAKRPWGAINMSFYDPDNNVIYFRQFRDGEE